MKFSVAFLLALFCTISFFAFGQESDTTYWKKGGMTSLTFSQVSLTNWAAGGDNSVSLNGYVNLFANYVKGKSKWENDIIMGYGVIRQGDSSVEKTDDRLNIVTQYGHQVGEKTYWTNILDFRTQFYEGVNADGTRISDFMAPGYLVVSSGLDWTPSENFSLTYGPVTGKFTFVTDQTLANAGAFGVDAAEFDANGNMIAEGSRSRAEIGSFLKVKFRKEVAENVNFDTKLEMFANYLENFGNIDINFENAIAMKVNDWLSVNWVIQMIYDDDINIDQFNDNDMLTGSGPRTQFKSVFGVGLTYNFGANKE